MKKISTLSLCLTFTGCFLGAGYMSGQEIYQFFGAFGIKGVFGLIFAVIILFILGVILVSLVDKTKVSAIDRTVVGSDNKYLLIAVGAAEVIMLFGTFFVMIAGAGSLIEQVSGLPFSRFWGGALYTLLLCGISVRGIRGLVKVFTGAVPPLILFTVLLGAVSLVKMLPDGISFPVSTGYNPMIPNFVVGALAFSAYNFFCCVGVMCPVGLQIKSRRSVLLAIGGGAVCLFAVAFGVIATLAACDGASEAEIPMLYAASSFDGIFGRAFGGIYAILLMLAMIGAGLASLIPTVTYFAGHFAWVDRHTALFTLLVGALGYGLGCFGFSTLVGSVFSGFGFISLFIIIGVVRNYIRVSKQKK